MYSQVCSYIEKGWLLYMCMCVGGIYIYMHYPIPPHHHPPPNQQNHKQTKNTRATTSSSSSKTSASTCSPTRSSKRPQGAPSPSSSAALSCRRMRRPVDVLFLLYQSVPAPPCPKINKHPWITYMRARTDIPAPRNPQSINATASLQLGRRGTIPQSQGAGDFGRGPAGGHQLSAAPGLSVGGRIIIYICTQVCWVDALDVGIVLYAQPKSTHTHIYQLMFIYKHKNEPQVGFWEDVNVAHCLHAHGGVHPYNSTQVRDDFMYSYIILYTCICASPWTHP